MNRKRLFIYCIIFILVIIIGKHTIGKVQKNIQIRNANKEIIELFKPTIDNTSFIIDRERFVLTIDTENSGVVEGAHFSANKLDAKLYYLIYKNKISDDNFVGAGVFFPKVKKTKEGNLRIYNETKSGISNVGMLFESFVNVYYDNYFNKQEALEKNVSGWFNEEKVKFDDSGNVTNKEIVKYHIEIQGKGFNKMIYDTEFLMKHASERLEIFIDTSP